MYNYNNNYEKCFQNSVSAQLVPDLVAYYYFFMWLAGRQASQPSLEKKKNDNERNGWHCQVFKKIIYWTEDIIILLQEEGFLFDNWARKKQGLLARIYR